MLAAWYLHDIGEDDWSRYVEFSLYRVRRQPVLRTMFLLFVAESLENS